jgi:hypothetical protein
LRKYFAIGFVLFGMLYQDGGVAGVLINSSDISKSAAKDDLEFTTNLRVTNSGQKPLHLTGVHTSCGCVVGSIVDSQIAPGEVGRIAVRVLFDYLQGNIVREIVVQTDDPVCPILQFFVAINIPIIFSAVPDKVQWKLMGKKSSVCVMAKIDPESRLRFSKIQTTLPIFKAKVKEVRDDGGIVIEVTPDDLDHIRESLLIVTYINKEGKDRHFQIPLEITAE